MAGGLTPGARPDLESCLRTLIVSSGWQHSYMRDTRDDALLGTRGSYVKLSQEFAGLGGDAQFYKAEGAGQLARRLLPGVVSPPLT